MAIGYAKIEFVKRSSGKNACCKAAYNARTLIHFKGTPFQEAKIYNWSCKEAVAYHEILLPEGANTQFKDPEFLWNAVEQKENRVNSQLALEVVLALPDDECVSLDHKIELCKRFFKPFVDKGLIIQFDIHPPDKKIVLDPETGEIDKFNHNWHAHGLITTRKLKENRIEFEDHKVRDMMPEVRKGRVTLANDNAKTWTDIQNKFFIEYGLNLQVDLPGIVSQKHQGPIRMRNRNLSYLEDHMERLDLNAQASKDPKRILEHITSYKNIFSFDDVERFFYKHLEQDFIPEIREAFWKQANIVQLVDPLTEKALNKFSTHEVLEEEKQIVRLADKIHSRPSFNIEQVDLSNNYASKLSSEQRAAFQNTINGQALTCIEGYAGTGKSHLLVALKNAYESEGYTVRAFGPDHATSSVLKEKGFENAETLHRFLFSLHHQKRLVAQSKEVWVVDEASKLSNKVMLEFLKQAKTYNAQIVFSGDSAQMSSVERGGVFAHLSKRYGAQYLTSIQRQEDQTQRLISSKLAIGNISEAFDLLASRGHFKWTEDKQEAMGALIKKRAADQAAFPNQTSTIIAHSNKDVKILNELIRLERKQKGELGEKDYQCNSWQGKIVVSVGDLIEFRAKDNRLGVTNGLKGTLIEASCDKFVVLVKEQGKGRQVSFDPKDFSGFQLGYVKTNFRSQGDTFDRAYVLYSPMMNKAGTYVALTRHVKDVSMFISRTEAKSISDLKRQAYRNQLKESTLDFTSEGEIHQKHLSLIKEKQLQELKSSSSLLSKLKGHALSVWGGLVSKTEQYAQDSRDLKPNSEFFNPLIKLSTISKGEVKEFSVEQWFKDHTFTASDLLKSEQSIDSETLKKSESPILKESTEDFKQKFKKTAMDSLSESSRSLLEDYNKISGHSSHCYNLVKAEVELKSITESKALYYRDWKSACAQRNEKAHEVLKAIPTEKLSKIIGKDGLEILQDRSSRYLLMHQRLADKQVDLNEKLKDNLEALIDKLYPEGPSRKNNRELRFGSKGSLAVTCRGENRGSFYDFEERTGGGPLQLIQKALSMNKQEAKEWAKAFLGQSPDIKIPIYRKTLKEPESHWISLKPDKEAPGLEVIAPKLCQEFKEVARHCYKDIDGNHLFYVLRLVDIKDPSKKSIRPLSYGYWKENLDEPQWALKAYSKEHRTLYHLDQLKVHPEAKVLVVEGEKTADAAKKLFANDNIVCVTWVGGAAAVAKTDWTSLYNRDVIIWPDNDEAGFKAADEICTELRKVGVKSLGLVDKEILRKEFPAKWDLADPQPQSQSVHLLKTLLLNSKNKAVGLDQLTRELEFVQKIETKHLLMATLEAKEVLWRVEERLRSDLEKKFGGKHWEINQEILKETFKIINEKVAVEKRLESELGIAGDVKHKIAYQAVLHEAAIGKPLPITKIEEIKQVLANTKVLLNPPIEVVKDQQNHIENKVWSAILDPDSYIKFKQRDADLLFQEEAQEINKQLIRIGRQDSPTVLQKQKDHGNDFSL